MDLLRYLVEGKIDFIIASIPLVIVFLQLKVFRHSIKETAICLSLNLMVSIYFWIKLKESNIALYQIIAYASGYIWLVSEGILKNMESKKKQ